MRKIRRQPDSFDAAIGAHTSLGARIVGIRELQAAWSDAVGAELAAVAFPLRCDGDTLVVGVLDTIWSQELSLMTPQILARMAQRTPATAQCRRLRCEHITPGTRPEKPAPRPLASPPLPAISSEAIARIADPALRDAFARLAATNRSNHGAVDEQA